MLSCGNRQLTFLYPKVIYDKESRAEILELLEEHIRENVVKVRTTHHYISASDWFHKIGKSYYKQVVGIPQGSVLSSLLCSFFYGDLEEKRMQWHKDPDCVRRYYCPPDVHLVLIFFS